MQNPCDNCESTTCMGWYDFPCNARVKFLYWVQKMERKKQKMERNNRS